MKVSRLHPASMRAMTLLEMTLVILVLLSLIAIGFGSSNKLDEWKLGRTASETLRTVYSAQRTYLADNPTEVPSSLTHAKLLPYMVGKLTAMPTIKVLDGRELAIRVTVIPPEVDDGAGGFYDPSGSDIDQLWDVGEKRAQR